MPCEQFEIRTQNTALQQLEAIARMNAAQLRLSFTCRLIHDMLKCYRVVGIVIDMDFLLESQLFCFSCLQRKVAEPMVTRAC